MKIEFNHNVTLEEIKYAVGQIKTLEPQNLRDETGKKIGTLYLTLTNIVVTKHGIPS